MNRNTFILFGSAIALLIVTVALAVFLSGNRKENSNVGVNTPYEGYITPLPGSGSQPGGQSASQPASKTIGSITATQLSDGHYLLENKNDGYQITVTSDWTLMPEERADFTLYYGDSKILEQCAERCNNVVVLSIKVLDNRKQYSFDEWFKNLDTVTTPYIGEKGSYKEVMINGQIFFRGSQKSYEPNDYGEIVPRNDSSIINYLFFRESKVYRIKCSSSGSDYKNLIQICENQVKSFSIK